MDSKSKDFWIITEVITEKVRLVKSRYPNGSLRLISYRLNKNDNWYEPYKDFTIDLNHDCQDAYHAFIAPEYDEKIYERIASDGLGYDTDEEASIDGVVRRLVKFDTRFIDSLREYDSESLPNKLFD